MREDGRDPLAPVLVEMPTHAAWLKIILEPIQVDFRWEECADSASD